MALEDKLKKLAERKAAEQSFDWNAERDKWLRALGRIYTDIEGWMQPYVAKKLATTRRTQIELSEEKIGKYKCQVLEIDSTQAPWSTRRNHVDFREQPRSAGMGALVLRLIR